MMRYLGALLLLAVSLGGCAAYPDVNRERLESLPQRYVKFDAALAWEIRDEWPGMVIDGMIQNRRFAYMEGVEVWVAVLDAAGKRTARSMGFVIPHQLQNEEIAPFTVKLPVEAVPGTRLRFTYKYKAMDAGSDGGGGGPWMQSFDAKVPSHQ
ncbi:MAG: hypothetical protein A2075_05890 [Geobacteraceae bacterium GWC2_58_44]|nr:MAG: hypothetical protein A2075_05890 [Geobacteraceae bacterium GWC2_58_44]